MEAKTPPAKSSRAARARGVRAKQKIIRSMVVESGHVAVTAEIVGKKIGKNTRPVEYTSRDASLLIAAASAAVPDDYRFFDRELEQEFGKLYLIGWAIQDHHRRFRAEENPLYAWHALAILSDQNSRDVICRNGERLAELRRCLDTGVPDTWSLSTLREIEIREWIGDPLPDWIADYLASAAVRLIAVQPGKSTEYGTTVAQALGLSKRGGGKSEHARVRESADRKKRHALRLIKATAELGEKLSLAEVADIFGVSINTAKDWTRKKV